ncbi:hypothetical protein [Mycoplasma sp. P36-A1]|uniref:hypothetical protein n=1 Tax=Mycoplasma sp. P36-A1 TaxID=3252900 RepID=UPI003C2FF16F
MKIKLIVDFMNPKSKDIVDYLFEYRKTNDLDLEIVSYDEFHLENKINNAYYGLYYANRMGNSLDYVKCVLDRKYVDGKDIADITELADCYSTIGYDKNDFIDALHEGDYPEMHAVFQEMYKNKGICEGAVCIAYPDNVEEIYDLGQLKAALDAARD